MGKWEKLGRIYDPALSTQGGHGANPVAAPLSSGLYRIFFNVRDNDNRSYITFLDFDIENLHIVDYPQKLIISPGEQGTFDDMGCSLGWIVDFPDHMFIYYLGWNLLKTAPWVNSIGLAIYEKHTGVCRKHSSAPIMGRADADPISISYPCVLKTTDGYKMWYGSHLTWGDTTPTRYGFNHVLKYAVSSNGISWERKGIICVQGDGSREYAFSKPSVLYENGLYKMWYAYRGDRYRIGYAESSDGIQWTRKDDEVGIDVSPLGWDSEEVSYPMVFVREGKKYMLYCGNGYGRTGFGLARWVEGEI